MSKLNAKILIAEDFIPNQEVLIEILKELGCTYELANNGHKVLEVLEENNYKFDAILMDCQMPFLDGFETTEEIRINNKGKEIPIIAMTASEIAGDKEKCLEKGMNDFMIKPIKIDNLSEILKKHL